MNAERATAFWPRIYADARGYDNYNYNGRNADRRRCMQMDADRSRRRSKLLSLGREER